MDGKPSPRLSRGAPYQFLILLVLLLLLVVPNALAEKSYSIHIVGIAFDHSKITFRVISSGIEILDKAVRDAVNIWNRALRDFASIFGYQYLLGLRLEEVEGKKADVAVRYVEELSDACGKAEISYLLDGRIREVNVLISKACVDRNYSLAMAVAEHEIGHALGLGHSDYIKDLMYNRLNGFKTPSTLDLYALSRIYAWMEEGDFHPPKAETTELPNTISYAYLPMEEGRVVLRFWMRSDLGVKKLSSIVAVQGEEIPYEVDKIEYYGNGTQFVFKGWYDDKGLVTTSNKLVVKAASDADYYAVYEVRYLVEIDLGFKKMTSWIRRGEETHIEAPEVKKFVNDTRLVFEEWLGDLSGMDRIVTIKVYRPIRASVRWRRQYFINIVSNFSNVSGGGWRDEGQDITISILNPITFLNNGETKVVLTRISVDYISKNCEDLRFENVSEITLNVCSPAIVTTKWLFYHHVVASSSHIKPIIFDRWVLDGNVAKIEVRNEHVWPNGTKIEFVKWVGDKSSTSNVIELLVKKPLRIHAVWKIYYLVTIHSEYPIGKAREEWMERGSRIYLNASPTIRPLAEGVRAIFMGWRGNISQSSPYIEVEKLNGPMTFEALWKKQYLIRIKAPKEAGIQEEGWVDSGGQTEIYAPPEVKLSNETKLVFSGWKGYPCWDPVCKISLVSRPLNLEAEYRFEWLIKVYVNDVDGERLNDVYLVLRHGNDSVEVFSGESVWIYEGEWVAEKAVWRGFDVSSNESIYIERLKKSISVPVRVFRAAFRVTDYLGFPIKDAAVIVRLPNGTLLSRGKTGDNGEVWGLGPLPSGELVVETNYLWFNSSKTFDIMSARPVGLTLPLSLTTIYGSLIIISLFTAMIGFAAYRKRKERFEPEYYEHPTEYPLPPPPPPPHYQLTEHETRGREKGEAVVVSVEEVLESIEDEELKKILREKESKKDGQNT